MILRPRVFQNEAVDSIFDYFASGKTGNPIVGLPTGTGKSIVIGAFLDRVFKQWSNQRILVLTHVKELIGQNYSKAKTMLPGLDIGVYSAGLKRRDTTESIIFAGIQSVAKKAVVFGHVDLILIDECHLVSPSAEAGYGSFIDDLKMVNPHLKVIGLTATPYRLGLGLMTNGQIFDDICCDRTQGDDFVWFIDQGYLCKLLPKPTKTQLNIEGVHKRGGEFIPKELQAAVGKEETTRAAVMETLAVAGTRKKWMFFTTGIDHADLTTRLLRECGVETICIHSRMTGDRDAELARFLEPRQLGDKPIALVNVDTLTTGFDCVDLDLIVMLRPTMSPGLWVQILGRGTRPAFAPGFDLSTVEGRLAAIAAGPAPDCMVLDFAGNTARLGPINRVQVPNAPGGGGQPPPAKLCPEDDGGCGTYIWAASIVCEHCGYEFPPPKHKLKETASEATLVAGIAEQFDIRELNVAQVSYRVHTSKRSGSTTLQVSYLCGLMSFNEYVCVEHQGGPRRRAERWWQERTHGLLPPFTAEEALDSARSGVLSSPRRISIRFDTKHPEILRSYDFVSEALSERTNH